MAKQNLLRGLAYFTVLFSAGTSWAQLRVEPDKENVVASRLEGHWALDVVLSKGLGGRGPEESKRLGDSGPNKVAFKNDATVTAKIPAKYDEFLKAKRIYMAGTMIFQEKAYPFILIETNGNPHLVYFRERDGDPLGDAESFIVMMAGAKERDNDLLFVGGDFSNEAFCAYRRAEPEPPAEKVGSAS